MPPLNEIVLSPRERYDRSSSEDTTSVPGLSEVGNPTNWAGPKCSNRTDLRWHGLRVQYLEHIEILIRPLACSVRVEGREWPKLKTREKQVISSERGR